MADNTLTNVVTKEYLLTSLENFTRDILLNHFVEQEDGKFLISANDLSQITKNTSEITYIKENLHEAGLSEEEVTEIVITKIAEVVAGADASYDTLKEIADWILNHEESASAMNSAIARKADGLVWDKQDNTLSLMSGSKIIQQVTLTGLSQEGQGNNYVVEPTFTMDWSTNHLIMTGGKGLVFNIRKTDGHLESEVL